MEAVDTNVLVYAADRRALQHADCRAYLEQLRHGDAAWFLFWNVVYEFVRVVTHPRVFRTPWDGASAWGFVRALTQSPGCQLIAHTERHGRVAETFFSEFPIARGNLVHDAHSVVLMREHGIRRLCTYDSDFYRFGVEVVTPEARLRPLP